MAAIVTAGKAGVNGKARHHPQHPRRSQKEELVKRGTGKWTNLPMAGGWADAGAVRARLSAAGAGW